MHVHYYLIATVTVIIHEWKMYVKVIICNSRKTHYIKKYTFLTMLLHL